MAEKTTTVTISDDRTVKIRYVELVELLIDGHIPDVLTGMVEGKIAETMAANGIATDEEQAQAKTYAEAEYSHDQHVRLIRTVVFASAVEPRIVVSPKEARKLRDEGVDALHISQLSGMDQMHIYYAAQGMVAALAELFLQQARKSNDLEPVPDGAGDTPSTGETARDPQETEVGALHGEHGGDQVGQVGHSAPERVGRTRQRADTKVRAGAAPERPKRAGKRR